MWYLFHAVNILPSVQVERDRPFLPPLITGVTSAFRLNVSASFFYKRGGGFWRDALLAASSPLLSSILSTLPWSEFLSYSSSSSLWWLQPLTSKGTGSWFRGFGRKMRGKEWVETSPSPDGQKHIYTGFLWAFYWFVDNVELQRF